MAKRQRITSLVKREYLPLRRPHRLNDLTGRTFGRLTVEAFLGICRRRTYFSCRCTCGGYIEVTSENLQAGKTASCGCLWFDSITSHDLSHTPEYKVWIGIKMRCFSPKETKYHDYGGRGITMCDRWKDDVVAFFEDMGKRPSPRHEIERIDNNGHYEPGNCRWATRKEQCNNTRRTRFLTVDGITMSMVLWSEKTGIPAQTIRGRLRAGWSDEEAIKGKPR